MSLILNYLDKSRQCQSMADLTLLTQSSFEQLGFNRWAYQTQSNNILTPAVPIIVHNFPVTWVNHYVASNYSELDPVITHGGKATKPFQWSAITQSITLPKSVKNYQSEAQDFGLVDGVGVPIFSHCNPSSMVSVASDQKNLEIQGQLDNCRTDLISVSLAFHSMASGMLEYEKKKANQHLLTAREKECLLWSFKGKSAWEIGAIIGRTERAVVFHIENAKKKLKTSSRQHAVVKAILERYITP